MLWLYYGKNSNESLGGASKKVSIRTRFYSWDIGLIWRVAEALEYAIVGVNTGAVSNELGPFGSV